MEFVIDAEGYTLTEGAGNDRPVASDAVALRTTLAQLMEIGFRRFLCPVDDRVITAFRDLRSTYRFEVDAVVVNAAVHSREMQTYGMAGFARRKLAGVRPLALPRLGLSGARQAMPLLRKDFRSAVSFLGALELSRMSVLRPDAVFLHQNSVDLATATRSRGVFEAFAMLTKTAGLRSGLISTNAGTLVPALEDWKLPVGAIVTPVIASGYHMNPTRPFAEAALRTFGGHIIAAYPGPAANIGAQDLAVARDVGAGAMLVRLDDAAVAVRLLDLAAAAG